jgi:hypothetical protein
MRQGPHQVAQKFNSTTFPFRPDKEGLSAVFNQSAEISVAEVRSERSINAMGFSTLDLEHPAT